VAATDETDETDLTIRREIVAVAQRLLSEGLVKGTSGNVSARRDADHLLVTPSGVAYETMTEDDVVAVDLRGRPIASGPKPSSDTPNHIAIYESRPDVAAIVHSHSPYATAFAVVGEPIPPLVAESAGFLGGAVRVAGYVGLGSGEGPGELAAALASDRAILMPNHGQLAVGEDLPRALAAAIAVEEAARIAWLARAMGTPRVLPDSDVEWMNAFIHGEYGQR
jgi:L-fuculose-phosphate aldolase